MSAKCAITTCALLCIVLTACGGGGGGDEDGPDPDIPVTTTDYAVTFTPAQVIGETPASDTVTATAALTSARGDGTTASGSVTVSGATASAVTINVGYAGENGPVAVALESAGGSTWNVPAQTELDDDEFFRLQATGYYVSISTPQGQLRGQILPPGWALGMIEMDASQVVPAVSSTATAVAGFTVNPATGHTRSRITVTGIGDVISAGIRNAIPGARGDVVIALEQSLSDPSVWGSRDINNPDAGSVLGGSGIDLLLEGSLYFSVETMTNPDGELRGQIIGDATSVFDVALTDAEVVTAGTPVVSSATGAATVTWTDATGLLAVAVNTDAQNVTSVSVHEGARGEVGPVVLELMPDVTLPGNWYSPLAELTEAQANAFIAGDFYVNVVTAAKPEGELRGQLVEAAPASPLSIKATLDESTRRDEPIDVSGGALFLTTATGVLVNASVPAYTVADMSDFSMTEISAIDDFPGEVEFLAGVRMGPSGQVFGRPVTLTFDVSGKRRPGTMLLGFRSDDDGSNLRLLPLRDATGVLGWYGTASAGEQVSLDTVRFSNYGVIEALVEEVPPLLEQFRAQGADFELPEEFVLRMVNATLETNLDLQELENLSDELLAELVRARRRDLHEDMADFMRRDELTTEDHLEYAALALSIMAVNMFDFTYDEPVTSKHELQDSIGFLVDLATVYGAGLHLQCFVNPEGVDEPLDHVAFTLILHVAEELIANNPDVSFDDINAATSQLAKCYNPTVLNAYFESFDVPEVDLFTGTTENIEIRVTDNLTGAVETSSLDDVATDVRFQEPRLVSTEPLTIEFLEISETITGLFSDTARIVFDAPGEDERSARIELAQEDAFPHATSAEEQEDGERAIITTRLSTVASGPIVIALDKMEISYSFDALETTDALLENKTRRTTGDVSVSKNLTPLAFSFEIDPFE